jgi:hypothetical protein
MRVNQSRGTWINTSTSANRDALSSARSPPKVRSITVYTCTIQVCARAAVYLFMYLYFCCYCLFFDRKTPGLSRRLKLFSFRQSSRDAIGCRCRAQKFSRRILIRVLHLGYDFAKFSRLPEPSFVHPHTRT